MRAAVLLLCYVYLGLLSYYTLMLMLVMKQRDAIACMTVWFASFFSEQMLTQPATLLITGFLLPAFVAHQFVEPIFRRRREKRHQDLRHAAGRAAMLSSASRRHLLVLGTGAGSRRQAGATAAGHASLALLAASLGLFLLASARGKRQPPGVGSIPNRPRAVGNLSSCSGRCSGHLRHPDPLVGGC